MIARAEGDAYHVAHAEMPSYATADVADALARISTALGWSGPGETALARLIKPGTRTLVKPNWVMHANRGPWGTECLITHPALVRAVVGAVLEGPVAEVRVGDAPIQGCDFDALVGLDGLAGWADSLRAADPRFRGLVDFRRTRSRLRNGVLVQSEEQVELSEFVLFDLDGDSLLEPVTTERNRFRVTQYDPRKMAQTHRPGRHQYLVARAVLEADLVVNLPKLKTHRKAGITNALKNLVGINGNKEYLPHHRVGGSRDGGDCYPGRSWIKRTLELVLDVQNQRHSHLSRWLLNWPARALSLGSRVLADPLGIEGSWSGNDTVWRMCLDLNRILLFGRTDGTLGDEVQRRVVTLVDAGMAGQGDGPLAPEPFPLGLMLGGNNSAAVDWIAAGLLGYIRERVPLVREAFGDFRWPIAPLGAAAVQTVSADGSSLRGRPRPQVYPLGWLTAVDRQDRTVEPLGRSFSPRAALPTPVPEA
jgi:uncharacterized protein (DUF362 family)